MFRSGVEGFLGNQVGGVVQDAGRQGDIRHTQVETHRVLVEDIDILNSFHRATVPVAANGGVFDAQNVQLHRFRVDLAAVVKQHAFA